MADEDLPDSLEPGHDAPSTDVEHPDLPKGDVRVASWIALLAGIVVVTWYLGAILLGGIYLDPVVAGALQVLVWILAAVAFACGLVCLNARRHREFAAAGFVAGVVSLLVSVTLGVSAGLQVLF